ncbi:MAG: hypothetical protein ACOC3I_10265 [Verrucomicrobiota bacterium]
MPPEKTPENEPDPVATPEETRRARLQRDLLIGITVVLVLLPLVLAFVVLSR